MCTILKILGIYESLIRRFIFLITTRSYFAFTQNTGITISLADLMNFAYNFILMYESYFFIAAIRGMVSIIS